MWTSISQAIEKGLACLDQSACLVRRLKTTSIANKPTVSQVVSQNMHNFCHYTKTFQLIFKISFRLVVQREKLIFFIHAHSGCMSIILTFTYKMFIKHANVNIRLHFILAQMERSLLTKVAFFHLYQHTQTGLDLILPPYQRYVCQ